MKFCKLCHVPTSNVTDSDFSREAIFDLFRFRQSWLIPPGQKDSNTIPVGLIHSRLICISGKKNVYFF